ncbi:DEAD/DEAH box helicase family protein [Pseudomonadota bacterium]
MSNFAFVQADFPALYADALEAEKLTFVSPTPAAILCRSSLENAVNWLYDHDAKLIRPWRPDLNTLLHDHNFRAEFPQSMFRELNLIRKTGNAAAHGGKIKQQDALASLKYLFRFLLYINMYYGKSKPASKVFDERLIPQAHDKQLKESQQQVQKLLEELEEKNSLARNAEIKIQKQAEENAQLKQQLEQQKIEFDMRKTTRMQMFDLAVAVPLLVSEAETRKRYIDMSLQECGWNNLREGRDLEYEVTGMPKSTNPSGIGYVDYVLWGDDGLPLAVVEAKKTMADPRKGKHQATLYANCLEAMHGQRPIIFYTNGFETWLWDDQFYPEREVQGFYDKDELQLLIDRRSSRTDLREFKVNEAIAGRAYQLEAIKRVAENTVITDQQGVLRGRARQSLLVMATGSGKTRTAAGIVDMLSKCNWAKRVLFLADRNALVTQAKNAFNEYLPNLSAIDLTKEREDNGTRLVFSTYPTIMNRIDGLVTNDQRFYGIGHFDLIIVDEAHRSVYQKYGAIFEYFDALLIGLTATPKTEVDHNTYGLFGIEDDNPTFAYELNSAVAEHYLVPPRAVSVPLKFMREGVKYADLSDTEKAQYEEKFGDPTTEEVPDEISSKALNDWLFNTDTVDKVLNHLMINGIKVQGGDRLGKTIIFAKSHKHAIFIEERFNKNYPEYVGKFLRVIDNYESKAQDLLEIFVDAYEEHEPQIAVSVDMMDTGVDAPRVVNLVFFKQVKSPTKFWQMIGRGTRLCPDLFAVGEHKTEFAIFDFCQNFEFFDANPDGMQGKAVKSLSQQTFEAKLEIALLIREQATSNDEQRELAESYIAELHQNVASLDQDRFVVKAVLRYVVEYSDKERWVNLSKGDMLDINTYLSVLIVPHKDDDEFARRFDVLLLNYQLALLSHAYRTDFYINKISRIAKDLLKKQNIPAVAVQVPLLNELQTEPFWLAVNVNRLDQVRLSLRDLMKYLDKESRVNVTTTFEDELDEKGIREPALMPTFGRLQSYRDRVESYVRSHDKHLIIQKLKTNKPITETELNELERILFDGKTVGTKQDYLDTYGDKPLGEFIRGIVGLDVLAAQEAFAAFIQAGNLRADQMTFINQIISYLTKNGTIDKKMLFESPFTNIHDQGLLGVFDDAAATKVIKLIDHVNDNALVRVVG